LTCRNKLMNEGKPYPKSGCDVCGSMFGRGRLVCSQGVEPKEGADPKYYISTTLDKPEEARDKYAAVIKGSYFQAGYDPGEPGQSVKYETLEYFADANELKAFLLENKEKQYNSVEIVRVIRYQELKVKTEVVISLD